MNGDAWNSHQWSSANPRQVEIEPGKSVTQRHCSRCMRDFVEDTASGERYAVAVSVFVFRKVPDQISTQWLSEMCPGALLQLDVEVRGRLIENQAKQNRARQPPVVAKHEPKTVRSGKAR